MKSENLRNSNYRERFRLEIIPKWYRGVVHVFFNFSLLVGTLVFYISLYKSPHWWDFLPALIVLLLGNVAVFFIHKYPLHRLSKWGDYAYENHTRRHHSFFNQNNMTYKNRRDWFIVFFPPEVVLGFVLIFQPAVYFGLSLLLPQNAVYSFLWASSFYFIMYEVFHFASHLPSGHWALRFPFLRRMRTHHQIHHDPKLMGRYNFNIVYPLWDWLSGTSLSRREYEELSQQTLSAGDSGDYGKFYD